MSEKPRDRLNPEETVDEILEREREKGRIEFFYRTTPEDDEAINKAFKLYKDYQVTDKDGENARILITRKPFGVELRTDSNNLIYSAGGLEEKVKEETGLDSETVAVTKTGRDAVLTLKYREKHEDKIDLFLDPDFQQNLENHNIKLGSNSPDKKIQDIFKDALRTNNYTGNEMRRGSLLFKTRENQKPATWNKPEWV